MKYFVTGIDTNIGKTVVAAILAEALGASYWKPVQSGDLGHSDSMKVKSWTSNTEVHSETYRLNHPISPHESAKLDGVEIDLKEFSVPMTKKPLIIEGAGGLMVPLNDNGDYIVDLIAHLGVPVFLVVKNYLGSINHTLLSIELLKSKNISIEGIIVNGMKNKASEEIIAKNTSVPILFHVEETQEVNRFFIQDQAQKLKEVLELL